MGLEISKRFSSYSFHLMSAKLYEDISYHLIQMNYGTPTLSANPHKQSALIKLERYSPGSVDDFLEILLMTITGQPSFRSSTGGAEILRS